MSSHACHPRICQELTPAPHPGKAPNREAHTAWLAALTRAAICDEGSIGRLSIEQLRVRCLVCGVKPIGAVAEVGDEQGYQPLDEVHLSLEQEREALCLLLLRALQGARLGQHGGVEACSVREVQPAPSPHERAPHQIPGDSQERGFTQGEHSPFELKLPTPLPRPPDWSEAPIVPVDLQRDSDSVAELPSARESMALKPIWAGKKRGSLQALSSRMSLLGNSGMLSTGVRRLVSKSKMRFQQDGFDLDLSYITPRIIAMGFPATGIEAKYRNNMEQVRQFFARYHAVNRYRIFNLCEERVYEGHALGGDAFPDCLRHYAFEDHNPCCLQMVHPLCVDAAEWLNAHEDNVVAIHCKAGKGRTGMIVSCLLVHLANCSTGDEALALFARQRTYDGKGVTIPSQMRYVRWYAESRLAAEQARSMPLLRLVRVVIHGAPQFDSSGGCDPYMIVKRYRMLTSDKFSDKEMQSKYVVSCTRAIQQTEVVYDSRRHAAVVHVETGAEAELRLGSEEKPLLIKGDFKCSFYNEDTWSRDAHMFSCWLNTRHLPVGGLRISRMELDGACKKKQADRFPPSFSLEILTEAYPPPLPAYSSAGSSLAVSSLKLDGEGGLREQPVASSVRLGANGEFEFDSESDGEADGAEDEEDDMTDEEVEEEGDASAGDGPSPGREEREAAYGIAEGCNEESD